MGGKNKGCCKERAGLKSKGFGVMSGNESKMRKKALIINTASYERVAFALSLASAFAALGEKVSVLFSYGGVLKLRKGHEDEIGEETNGWMKKREFCKKKGR